MKSSVSRTVFAIGAALALIGCSGGSAYAQQQNTATQTAPTVAPVFLPKPPAKPADWLVEHPPVNPNATPEAKALLHFLYRISGKQTLAGQHNYAARQEYSSNLATTTEGKTPIIYGTDLGFASAGDKDSAYVRHQSVQTLIQQWQRGSIIALCWHEVPPTEDEPVTGSFLSCRYGELIVFGLKDED